MSLRLQSPSAKAGAGSTEAPQLTDELAPAESRIDMDEWQPLIMRQFSEMVSHAESETSIQRCRRDAGSIFRGRIAPTTCPTCGAREIEVHPDDCAKFNVPEGSVLCE